ncbi:iron-containing redox enzyme family protein [Pendulispora brunnea]|uniref:Iron-containing redox enzyme family protein n=1 Tax=Pendulispora brunnea TaxID=2905690 RepID=A0ABZ2K2U6_9BACT
MKALLDSCVARLSADLRRFPWENADMYGDWLAQTYYYVRHSTRLLAAAAARFAHDGLGDRLHLRFSAHMNEEKRHELLAVRDLEGLGRSLASFSERAATRCLYEPQYYKVEHVEPMALFGYILALEAMSATAGPSVLTAVRAAHAQPCTHFLRVHAEDDVEHVEKAFAVLDRVGPTARQHVEENLTQTTFAYLAMLDAIKGNWA